MHEKCSNNLAFPLSTLSPGGRCEFSDWKYSVRRCGNDGSLHSGYILGDNDILYPNPFHHFCQFRHYCFFLKICSLKYNLFSKLKINLIGLV